MDNKRYTYAGAGFNKFFRRSIDSHSAATLSEAASIVSTGAREINFDHNQTTGSLGDVIQVGTITIDGTNGKISVFEGSNEVVRIGDIG